MSPTMLILIALGVGVVWLYSKTAAASATLAQSPKLTVPQGSLSQSILSSLGIATSLVPGTTAAASAAETAAYTAAASTPGSLTTSQIVSGQDVGATSAQVAAANAYAQNLNASLGSEPDVIISSTASLLPQDDDSSQGNVPQSG